MTIKHSKEPRLPVAQLAILSTCRIAEPIALTVCQYTSALNGVRSLHVVFRLFGSHGTARRSYAHERDSDIHIDDSMNIMNFIRLDADSFLECLPVPT